MKRSAPDGERERQMAGREHQVALPPGGWRPITWRRRLFMPFVVILVAVGFTVWSRQRGAISGEIVEAHVVEMCRQAASGAASATRLPVADGLPREMVLDRLEEACAGLSARPEGLDVVVVPDSEDSSVPQGATHAATIRVDGRDRLVLHVRHDDGSTTIVGYRLPGVAAAPPAP